MKNSVVLSAGGDNVVPRFLQGGGHALNGGIVRLGAAPGEDYLPRPAL